MRWSIIRLIWLRELRDQLRDRRTMFVMVLLPLLLYPLGGVGLMQITLASPRKPSRLAIDGVQHLPRPGNRDYPPLLAAEAPPVLSEEYLAAAGGPRQLALVPLEGDGQAALDEDRADLVLVVPPEFLDRLKKNESPALTVLSRPDDRSLLARQRTVFMLQRWRENLNRVRFEHAKLPPRFDQPFLLADSEASRRPVRAPEEQIFDLLTRIFPFVLVLWSLAGALYPAVDLCAGEKERGTMETLLISPAQREEIVWGKFLTIWVFSAVTALLNLVSMAATSWFFSAKLASATVNVPALAWSVVLLLPLSAFFSALCLSVGAYARSTKEGQYYLMPLFVIVMPLVFLTLVPGVELNPFYAMVPVTGVSLLLEKLIQAGTPDPRLWLYFVPVLVPMVIYSWLALRWAIIQFQREEVLFREADRVEIGLWLRRLLREREPRPSAGQALFCFVVVLGLSWFSLGLGSELLATNIIRFLAFVATPTLLMAFLLTTQPRQSLAVRVPPAWAWPVAVLLVVVLTPPLLELTVFVVNLNPQVKSLIQEYRPAVAWLHDLRREAANDLARWWQALIVFAFLPAVCHELTFRGFILTGLQRRFRPRTAVFITSFLFCVMQMNVFQFVPTFILGLVLGYLTTRCGSILPAMLFQVLYITLLLTFGESLLLELEPRQRVALSAGCALPALGLLWWLTRQRPHPAYVAFLQSDPGMEPPVPDLESQS